MVKAKKVSAFYRNENGQSIIEFALLLPIMLLITFFALELSLSTYYKLTLNNMVREVARIISVSESETSEITSSKVDALIQTFATNGPLVLEVNDPEKFTLDWNEEIVNVTYKYITISATYKGLNFPFIGPIVVKSMLVYPKLYISPDIW
jgi:Flp pilus assembly protein TadG